MIRFDTARRGISLVLAVLCLLVVPELASAAFTNREPAVAELDVGAATLAAPTDVDGTYRCAPEWIILEAIDVTATKVSHTNPTRRTYTYSYELLRGNAVVDSATSNSPTAPTLLEAGMVTDLRATTWTLRVRVGYGNWTSLDSYEKSVTCSAVGWGEGPL